MFDLMPFKRRNRDLFDMEDFFADFFNNFGGFAFNNKNFNLFKTDIKETNNEYIVEAELPGVRKDDINIELNDNYMTISATSNEIVEEEKENYIRKERRSGKFQRSFNISNVNVDEIQAEFKNGLLKIKLPKLNKTKNVRRIDIN